MRQVSRIMKLGASLLFSVFCSVLFIQPAHASAPALKLTPLKYQEIIALDKAKIGFIDVANPSDSSVRIVSEVQAFKQINLEGDLEFYHDDQVSAGIQVASTDFELGPREAARVSFTVDPSKLHHGGVYASVFFRTVPPDEKADVTRIAASAKVGTLLILDIGGQVQAEGKIKSTKVPFWNFGKGFSGSIDYFNTANSSTAIAFNPDLKLKAGPWGKASQIDGPLVMPGNTRTIRFDKPGSYLGFVPLVLSDSTSHQNRTIWVFAVTGFWRAIMLLLIIILALRLLWPIIRRPN